ncbi:unnamed protein product [Mytilus coruscus]|uniref:Ig-like domain-containing protein n=1 Tax=Mytilus coruscus TaxID=42192 RepID=A0A6J8EL63_MYTCO|nr:unnamed protein product [Mytilus coruscus]
MDTNTQPDKIRVDETTFNQSNPTESIITVYTAEGPTVNLTFNIIDSEIDVRLNKRYIYHNIDHKKVNTKQYDMVLHPNILEFQKINLTTKDTGIYWLDDQGLSDTLKLDISKTSCLHRATEHVCAIEGSSSILSFIFEGPLYYSSIKDGPFLGSKSRRLSNFTIRVDLHIYNVTSKDEGLYTCYMYDFGRVKLQVVKIGFMNQTDLDKIVGQEGIEMEIKCSADRGQIITALQLESHGTIKAIGDKQSVSYSLRPDRTDHLSKYKCVDSTHSSIMIEIELFIKYPPDVTVRYTNYTIQCECDGVPAIYSMYRLDQLSKSGELVRSINLKNETFTLQNYPFPYQINGRYECVVSNGIPDIDGKKLQTGSTTVQYEGAPVFAKENRRVKIGKVGDSIELSFYIYSFPDVEEIFLDKLEQTHNKKRKITNYKVLNSTLLYTEFDNKVGVQGYEYLIESENFNTDDFQAYCITAINRLGASDYCFKIIKKENTTVTKRKMSPYPIPIIVGLVLFGFAIIVNVCFWVKRTQVRALRDQNMPADPNYDEIESISYSAVINVHSLHTNSNQDQHLTHQGSSCISKKENVQTIVDNESHTSEETTSDFFDIGLLQREATEEVHHVSVPLNGTHISNIDVSGLITIIQSTDNTSHTNKEILGIQTSHTRVDSCSEPSNNGLEKSVGDGYENPCEYISQKSPENH